MVDLVLSKHGVPFDSQMSDGRTLLKSIANSPGCDLKYWRPCFNRTVSCLAETGSIWLSMRWKRASTLWLSIGKESRTGLSSPRLSREECGPW